MATYECFFFFQAEDGIRDLTVTGVQTCALPISRKGQFREFEATATALSVRLLRNAAAASRDTDTDAVEPMVEESGLFLRTVRDLRRIHSHLASFAYPILHRPRIRGRRATARGVAEAGAVNPPAAPQPIGPPKSTSRTGSLEEDDLG